jgi:hypothetical protein
MIDGAKLMLESLKKFKQRYKILPVQIIVYRDGVSTSQLTSIVLEEVTWFPISLELELVSISFYECVP